MTNTKFRKRALLSSVAMLLVALVALGSATFAWFNTQNNANAKTITANTRKSANVVLSESGGNTNSPWTHSLNFKAGTGTQYTLGNTDAIVPVTTKDLTEWNTAKTAAYNIGYAPTSAYTPVDLTNEGHIKHSFLYIKSTVAQTVTVTPNVTTAAATDTQFMRMLFKPLAAGSTVNSHPDVITKARAKGIIWTDTTGMNDRAESGWTQASENTAATATAFGSTKYDHQTAFNSPFTLDFAANDVYAFEVYVWAEGTDFECIDENAGTSVSIKFDVEGETTP